MLRCFSCLLILVLAPVLTIYVLSALVLRLFFYECMRVIVAISLGFYNTYHPFPRSLCVSSPACSTPSHTSCLHQFQLNSSRMLIYSSSCAGKSVEFNTVYATTYATNHICYERVFIGNLHRTLTPPFQFFCRQTSLAIGVYFWAIVVSCISTPLAATFTFLGTIKEQRCLVSGGSFHHIFLTLNTSVLLVLFLYPLLPGVACGVSVSVLFFVFVFFYVGAACGLLHACVGCVAWLASSFPSALFFLCGCCQRVVALLFFFVF